MLENNIPWTQEEIEQLLKLFKEGVQPMDIAQTMRTTVGTVYGKIRRLRAEGILPPLPPKIMKIKEKPETKMVNKKPFPRFWDTPPMDINGMEIPSIYGKVNIVSVKKGQCKFPMPLHQKPDEKMCLCGKPTFKDTSWCKEHKSLVLISIQQYKERLRSSTGQSK